MSSYPFFLKKRIKPVHLSPLSLLILTACGGSGGGGSSQNYSGFVIKGPLHNATVFADYDGDGIRDNNEPFALSNADGSYTLDASDDFSALVVSTDNTTIDSSSGSVVSGITLKAPKDAGVVSPTSTVVVESNLTVEEVAAALGLPEDFTLDFNPFDANADPEKAAVVEKTSQMVMATINAVSASAEGVGLSEVDAFKTALEAVIVVVKEKVETKSAVDFADAEILEAVQTNATSIAGTKGADKVAMHRALDAAIEKTKTINKNIKEVEDVFSEEAKEVFKTAAEMIEDTKTSAAEIKAEVVAEASGYFKEIPKVVIEAVATDNIINISEKSDGFKVNGTAGVGSEITVTFGKVTRTVQLGEEETSWEVNFNLTSDEKTTLNADYPSQVTVESAQPDGQAFTATKSITVNTKEPTVAINSIGGDGKVNIPEKDAGLELSGTTDIEVGQKIKVSLLKPSDNSTFTSFGEHATTVTSDGIWSITLPSADFPQESFKIKAIAANAAGNTKEAISDAIPVDFSAPTATITDNISGTATGDITYTINFDQAVSYFSSSAVTVTNGSVSSVTGSGTSYSVVVTPSAGAEGTGNNGVKLAMNPSGGAKDASGNNPNVQLGSGNSNASYYTQNFDTKPPSVTSISVLETGTSNAVTTVAGTVDFKVILSETVTGLTTADFSASSGTINSISGSNDTYTVAYTPASNVDGNVTFTLAGGGYQDSVTNSGTSGSKTFAVDTKSPAGSLSLPSGSFSLNETLNFSLTYDEPVAVASGDPFVVLQIGDRVRLAEKISSSDSSIVKFAYTVKSSDLDDSGGIGITATTGLSKSEHALGGNFGVGDTITVSGASGAFTVQSGATSASQVATALRTFLNSDSTFTNAGFKAAGLGSGKVAVVGTNAANTTFTLSNGASGTYAKDASESYTATIKDIYGNTATPTFSLSGDATGITVDGGASGVGVDGYIEGNTIYADNNENGILDFGDSTASTNQTGVFKIYGGQGPLVMDGGTDKATGLEFGVRYEAPAGYTSITPISSVVRSLETKDTDNTGAQATEAAEEKATTVIGLSSNVNIATFDAYNAVSDTAQISQAIAYQKAAAAVALVVDIGSTGFVELVKLIEGNSGTVPEAYRISGQSDPFTTQKASELMFDAISDAIISEKIGAGYLKTFGSSTGEVPDIASKLVEIITPTAQAVLGDNFSTYQGAIANEAHILAAGVDRVNTVASSENLTSETAITALIKIVQTQSVWQGDANEALEDENPNNDWMTTNATMAGNVAFNLVTTTGEVLTEGAEGYGAKDADGNLTWGGYELKIDGAAVDTSKYTVNWYKVTFVEDGDDTYSSVATPTSGEINDSSFTTLALQLKVAANADDRVEKGLTFEVVSATDSNTVIQSKSNSPVIRGTDGIINNSVASNIFTYGALADGAPVGVVVPTSYEISSDPAKRDQFEGGEDGTGAAEYSFTVTRKGNMSLQQSIEYEVEASSSLIAADFDVDDNKIPSGKIVFAPQQNSKTLTIKLINDQEKEGPENFNVRLKDSLGTAQILQDVVSFSIIDDDPTNPQLTAASAEIISVSSGDENNSTGLEFDYFDENSTFNISTLTSGGSVKFDGKVVNTTTDTFTFPELKRALEKISFSGEEGQNSGSALITVSDTVRGNSGDATIKYDIHNKPVIAYDPPAETTFVTGVFGAVNGISISDVDYYDSDGDGSKDPDEPRQTLKVSISSNGGKISFDDPNEDAKVTLDVADDDKGATILGKSDAVKSVLSSLKFSGDPNTVSGTITVTASDQDELTENVVKEIQIEGIKPAPPTIDVPKTKINLKAEADAPLPGIKVADIDSTSVMVKVSADRGSFTGIDPIIYQVSGLNSSYLSITGSPAEVNVALEGLKYKGVQGSRNMEISVDVTDSEGNSATEKGTISINIVDNQPPEPGGNLTFKQANSLADDVVVDEDSTDSAVTFNIPVAKLVNEDGGTPTDIRILSVEGGTLKLGGTAIVPSDESPKIELVEVKNSNSEVISYKKDFTFTPKADFSDAVIIEYAVVDPVLETANSLPSQATISLKAVNDAPELTGDQESVRIFTEDELGLFLDQGVSIKDTKDEVTGSESGKVLAQAIVELSNAQTDDELLYSDEFWDKVVNGQVTTLTSKSGMFGKAISVFETNIRSIKFNNSSNNPNTSETRVLKIRVKDIDSSAANDPSSNLHQLSSILTFNLNVLGKNDDPIFSSSGNIAYTEGAGEALILANAAISDPDGVNDSIKPKKATVELRGGYNKKDDILTLEDGYSAPTGLSATFESASSSGILTITAASNSTATMSDLQALLRKVVYKNTSDDPTLDPREIRVTVFDDKEAKSSDFSKTINLTAVNDNPTLDLDGDGTALKGQNTASSFVGSVHTKGVEIAPNADIDDFDGNRLSKLVVTLTNPKSAADNGGGAGAKADTLALKDQASNVIKAQNLSLTSSSNDTVITITGSALTSNYEDILKNIIFKSDLSPATTDRVITVVATDADKQGGTNKESKKLDGDGDVISGETQFVTVKILDNPQAIVNKGTKILTLTGNPEGAQRITVDLNYDFIKTDTGETIKVPYPLGDRLMDATSVDASGVTNIGVEIAGSSEVNTIIGSPQADLISGSGGTDSGTGKGDIIQAGLGNDKVDYDATAESIDGGDGTDTLRIVGSNVVIIDLTETGTSVNQVKVASSTGELSAASGSLVTKFEDVDASQASGSITIIGSDSDGSLSNAMTALGGAGNDIITTGSAADILKGGLGNDILRGSAGTDTLSGDEGADILYGGVGADTLKGGSGSDTFMFLSSDIENNVTDTLSDLQAGEKIGISSDVRWKGLNASNHTATPTLEADALDAYVRQVNGKYLLVIETAADGSENGYVDLGTSKPFEPAKWAETVSEGTKLLTVTDNTNPTLTVSRSTEDTPLKIYKAGVATVFDSSIVDATKETLAVVPEISVADQDEGDTVFITLQAEGGTLSSETIGSTENRVSITEANTQLKALTFTGTTRGDGKVTVTVSDGFSQVTDSIYLSVPNTAPVITVPVMKLTGTIGGDPPILSGVQLADVDSVDSGSSASMALSLTASSGVFVASKGITFTDSGQTFDHDGDAGTASLAIQKFSIDEQNYYLVQSGSVITIVSPDNPVDLSAGFTEANLSITGVETQSLELTGNLQSISQALNILGLEGTEAGTSVISAEGRDTLGEIALGVNSLGAATTRPTFEVEYGIGTPEKPSVVEQIANGVSRDELKAGFTVSVDIGGKGAKSGDQAKLFYSKDGGETIAFNPKVLTESDLTEGVIGFNIDYNAMGVDQNESNLDQVEGSYTFTAQLNSGGVSAASDAVALDFSGPTVPSLELVTNSSSVATDTGTNPEDGITQNVRPVINMTSEPGLETTKIYLDISDAKGAMKENKGTWADLLVFGTAVDNADGKSSVYPITFSLDLPDNNYGFYMVDSSGNKSSEALKITFDSVDEYGYEILSTISTIPDVNNNFIAPGTYAVLDDSENQGQSKLVLVFGQEAGVWGQVAGSQNISVLDNKISTLSKLEGQSFYPDSEGENPSADNIITLTGNIDSFAGYKVSLPENSRMELMYGQSGYILEANSNSNGMDNYLITADQAGDSLTMKKPFFSFEVTLPSGEKFLSSSINPTLNINSQELINYKSPGWFTIDTVAPNAGTVVLTEFEDHGRQIDDLLTNDPSFILTVDGREPFTSVTLERKLDSGSFEVVSKDQDLTVDGTYTYRAVVTDSAGNSSTTPEKVVTIETVVPVITANSFTLGTDDTGVSAADLITNVRTPTVEFISEAGLRVFLTKVEEEASPVAVEPTFDADTEKYTLSFSENLEDGTYNITVEDDAGNHSEVKASETFVLDATPPIFSDIDLIAKTDQGVDTSDRYTAVLKPVVSFDSEPGLRVFIEHNDGVNAASNLSGDAYSVSGGHANTYRIGQVFGTDPTGNEFLSFGIGDIYGAELSESQITQENLSLSFQYSSDGITFENSGAGHFDDGIFTIKMAGDSEETPELSGVTHIRTTLSDLDKPGGQQVLYSEEFSTKSTGNYYALDPYLFSDNVGLNVDVIELETGKKLTPSELVIGNLSVVGYASYDGGVTFEEKEKSGAFFDLSKEFSDATHVKIILEKDAGTPNAEVFEEFVEPINVVPGKYVIEFNNDLVDGAYKIIVEDDAGNNVQGTNLQTFSIDTVVPAFEGAISLGQDDLGLVKEVLYVEGDELPEGKALGDVKTEGDRLTKHQSPTIQFKAESGLRTFIEYDDLNPETDNIFLPDPSREGSVYEQNFDSGVYTISFKDGVSLLDGSYKIIIEDNAGNRIVGDTNQTFVVESKIPEVTGLILDNSTDTGKYSDDRLSNVARPEVVFNSESELRVFVEKASNTEGQSGTFLKLEGEGDNPDYSFVEQASDGFSQYSITFSNDLADGTYHVIVEDDAGNQNEIGTNQTFIIDREAPELSPIFMDSVNDTGVSETDLLTNLSKPTFEVYAEEGLSIFVNKNSIDGPALTEGTDYYYFGLAPVGYSLSFSSELTSGEYVISVRDDAGNKNIMADGSIAETFTVDLDSPVFIDSINLGKDDKGRSLDDRITNIARPEINFKAEQGLNISFLYSSGSEEPAPISPSFTVESLSGLNLSAEEKTIFDSLGLTSVGNYDPHPAAAVYTITQAHVDDNAGLGLTAGSYALWGNTADGWEVEPVNASETSNIKSIGSKASFSSASKTVFDGLSLTKVGDYDPSFIPVYNITSIHVSDNAGLGLTAGSYAFDQNASGQWQLEPVNATEAANIVSTGDRIELPELPNEIVGTTANLINLDATNKAAFDALGLTPVGTFDGSLPSSVYTIAENNTDLGLTADTSYALVRSATGSFTLQPVNITDLSNIVGTTANLINLDATNKAAFDALGLTPVGTFDGSLPSSVYTVAANNTDLGLTADTSYALVRSATGSFTLEPVNITDPISSFLGGLTQVGVYDPYVAAPVFTISQSDVENNPGLGLAPGNYALGGNENDGYELEQVDISNPQNIVSLGKEGNGSYKVSLTSDLDDGQYTLVITDDAGNEVIGGEEHQFVIEKVVPVVSTLVLDNGLDTGFLDNDRRTTERKPDFSFESEEGLRVFITKSIEVDERYSGPNKVYSLNEDHFGTMGAGSYAILDTGSEYLLEKVILDESTETNTTDYKVTSQEDDSISLAKDNVGITNFLNNEKEKSFLVEKTSADGTDKVAPFLAGQASSDTSAGTYTPDGGSAIKVYQLTSEQLSSSQGEGFYIIETTDTDYIFKEVEPNQETQDISNDYKIKPNDTSIGTYAVNPNSNLEEGVDYTVSNEGKNYSVSFITEFPDEKQGFYHVSVEDDAGNVNVVPTASTEQSIWVDNVMPVLQSANIDETGKLIKLFFSEELDTIPDIADYSITLSSGNGLTNDINLTGAQIERSADLKSEITISLKFPLFKEDNYKLDFVAENLGNYKDTVGKVLIDPSPVTVENGSLVVRSAGLVADGYITGATVFHDLNENGLFDENQEEVSVKTADDGTFKGLHGDVYKPLVSLGGVDSSTGLNFQSKSADGTLSDIALYAKSNATVINPLTSLVFQMEKVSKANNNVDVLDVFYNSESQEFSLAVNLEPINTSSYRVELNFLKDGIPQNVVYLNQNTISESEFNSIVTERFNNTDDFNQISFKVSKLVESEEGALVASSESIFSQIFSSLEEAKDYTSESNIVTSAQATEKVAEVFGLTNLSDIYNYDPIANDKVEIQAVSTQIGNLLTAIPYLVDTLSSSVDVFEKIVQQIFIASDENRELDLGKQEDLELIFGIDNSPPAEGEPAPDLLKELANANKQIGDAVTIDAQIFSQLIARDEIISNRTIRELSSLDPDFQTTDDPEKFIGSLDDDIIFASAGDDLFGDGTADHAIREGDIFIGGEGRDAVFLAGQESDYIFMSESPGSDLYGTIEMSLDHTIHTGNLGDAEILIVQKASDPTGFIYLQTEIIRFTDDVSWLSFDEATGGLSGNISSDDIKGSVFNTDIINGGQGNDILAGFGGLGDSFDLINGGGGDDSIIVEGKNTEATGGEGKDVFNVLGLNGTLLIKDFSLADDKIDLRAFEKSEGVVLTFADILASSSTFTEGEISGLKIDLSSWVKDAATYTGSVVIEEASKNSDGAMELIDGTILISENFYIETLTE